MASPLGTEGTVVYMLTRSVKPLMSIKNSITMYYIATHLAGCSPSLGRVLVTRYVLYVVWSQRVRTDTKY